MTIAEQTKLKIKIIEDDEDISLLYKDYLVGRGHEVACLLNADNIISEFAKDLPDILLIDYRLGIHKNGIDAAIEICTKFPLLPILIITAYYDIRKDIERYSIFKDKKVSVLIKPVLLKEIEGAIIALMN